MRKIARWSVSAATVLLFAFPALAQIQYRIEVYGGITFPMDKDFVISAPQSPVPIKGTHQFSEGGRGGIRLGMDSRGHWGQEIDYSYGSYASRIVNHANGADFAFTPRVHQISWNALWYPAGQIEGKATPYLTAGVGGVLNTLSQTAVTEALDPSRPPLLNPSLPGIGRIANSNYFAFNAGFGTRFRLSKRYSIRIDFRDHMSRAARYDILKAASLTDPRHLVPIIDPDTKEIIRFESVAPKVQVFPIGGIFHQLTASIAFVYHF